MLLDYIELLYAHFKKLMHYSMFVLSFLCEQNNCFYHANYTQVYYTY